jgi:hypothetical protein
LPQNSHFSAIFLPTQKFILGLGFPLEVSQNQATYSSRPSTSGKARLFVSPDRSSGRPCSFVRD